MKPTSESTALEGAEDFVEYVPAGKLKGKKALITGGEYASLLSFQGISPPHKLGLFLTGPSQFGHWPCGRNPICSRRCRYWYCVPARRGKRRQRHEKKC